MLSRLSLRNAQATTAVLRNALHTTAVAPCTADNRPKRLIDPAPVRHGFIPESWFTMFYPKTGVTGPYVFLGTLTTYFCSKEIFVLDHEYYTGVALAIIFVYGIKKFGPQVAAYLDKEIEDYANKMDEPLAHAELQARETIKAVKHNEWSIEAQRMLNEAKKEMLQMQLEAAYRERIAEVHQKVKQRLDYHTQLDAINRRLAQKHLSQWVIDNVMKSITPDLEKATLQRCIADLQGMAKA